MTAAIPSAYRDMGYIAAADGTPHAPIIGTRFFRWHCMCGASGSKLFVNRILAFNAWDRHFTRYERAHA